MKDNKIPTNLDLDNLLKEKTDISLEDLLEIVPVLGTILNILEGPLYIKRFHGMLRTTNKEDPMDCSYIRMCVMDLLEHAEDFQRLSEIIKLLAEKV